MLELRGHPWPASLRPRVLWGSLVMMLALLAYAACATEHAHRLMPKLSAAASNHFGGLYVYALTFFLLVALAICVSPWGKVRLGGPHAKPEFSRLTWAAMLLCAGMGIGLVFNGVAEPMLHYASPLSDVPKSEAAAQSALSLTFFHWGVSAWAGYVVMAMAIGLAAYTPQGNFLLRETLRPLLGTRVDGWMGDLVDISAVLGTLIGLAASLGMGAQQIVTGLSRFGWVELSMQAQLWTIGAITLAATLSLLSGLHHGIRRLSEINLALALLLALIVAVLGSGERNLVWELAQDTFASMGVLWERSLRFQAQTPAEHRWLRDWTFPYWAWWISWMPFVGVFIARISRGRSLRELVIGAVLCPSLATFAWFEVFGGAALSMPAPTRDAIASAVSEDIATSVFVFLEQLPASGLTCTLAMIVVTIFFVSSSDSASYVVDMLTSGGMANPPKGQRVFWALLEGACAGLLLLVGGRHSLEAMHAMVMICAVPYTLCMLLAVVALVISLARRGRDHARLG